MRIPLFLCLFPLISFILCLSIGVMKEMKGCSFMRQEKSIVKTNVECRNCVWWKKTILFGIPAELERCQNPHSPKFQIMTSVKTRCECYVLKEK